jgi:hypothetical protein
LFNNHPLGLLLIILSRQAFLVTVLIYLGFNSFGFQLCTEAAPLALGPTFGPSVEFWVRLPLHKTQVHVTIALSATRGTSMKTPHTPQLHAIGKEMWIYPTFLLMSQSWDLRTQV